MKWLLVSVVVVGACGLPLRAENIDPDNDDSQFAWGENVGWLNFDPCQGPGVTVMEDYLTGFIWAENIGWINLDPCYGGVVNDGDGILSGFAWGENVGWLNFDPCVAGDPNHYGVRTDCAGNFYGWAWGENIGWVLFQASAPVEFKVKTAWLGPCPGCWYFDTHCYGDVDGDGDVDTVDWPTFRDAFGREPPHAYYNPCADFDQDGDIDTLDWPIFRDHFGRPAPGGCQDLPHIPGSWPPL